MAPKNAIIPAATENPITALVGVWNANPEYFTCSGSSPISNHLRKPHTNIKSPNTAAAIDSIRSRCERESRRDDKRASILFSPLPAAQAQAACLYPRYVGANRALAPHPR
jgi:hypothetical protein